MPVQPRRLENETSLQIIINRSVREKLYKKGKEIGMTVPSVVRALIAGFLSGSIEIAVRVKPSDIRVDDETAIVARSTSDERNLTMP